MGNTAASPTIDHFKISPPSWTFESDTLRCSNGASAADAPRLMLHSGLNVPSRPVLVPCRPDVRHSTHAAFPPTTRPWVLLGAWRFPPGAGGVPAPPAAPGHMSRSGAGSSKLRPAT